jgi:hypothetical protein
MHTSFQKRGVGTASIDRAAPVVAGSYQSFKLVYTAGHYGIDDTGSIKVCHRYAADMGQPQFDDPAAPNYTKVVASNGAILDVRFDVKRNERPWGKTLYIKVVRGYLTAGDQITIHYGCPDGGSPGIRMQTFCEPAFTFRVLVDAIATYRYEPVPAHPAIDIVPGPPACYLAQLPTVRRAGEPFSLLVKAEDAWGNPTAALDTEVALTATGAVDGLPAAVQLAGENGRGVAVVPGLTASVADALRVKVQVDGEVVAESNPLRIVAAATHVPYWADLHGQSEETVGTNSVESYFAFARDCAGVDACVHQGNDFQITPAFWARLQATTAAVSEAGRFVAFPGWEWSGNTALGGDRNVIYPTEGGALFRSSDVLVPNLPDGEQLAVSADELFTALDGVEAILYPHVGGRYADLAWHDPVHEPAVEVHSAWGTFEWLLTDALRHGYRVGVTCNSDGHKGRPGASYPGASTFGSYGGLTCILARELSRPAIWEALLARRHYGTTGCRLLLAVDATFPETAAVYPRDPRHHPEQAPEEALTVGMGGLVASAAGEVELAVDIVAPSPVLKVEIRNGLDTVAVHRPYTDVGDGRRLRVIWSGAEYRGRGRQSTWDGSLALTDNGFADVRAINFFNPEQQPTRDGTSTVRWRSLTTGGCSGIDCRLSRNAGAATLTTPLVNERFAIADIGTEETVFSAGGLARQVTVSRLPADHGTRAFRCRERIQLRDSGDNAIYVCVTLADGHQAWSSPIYVWRP